MAEGIRKPRTNWHLVIWPILAIWLVGIAWMRHSGINHRDPIALPVMLVCTALGVLLLNAILGSRAQARYEEAKRSAEHSAWTRAVQCEPRAEDCDPAGNATPQGIARIEAELGLNLPAEYVRFLQNYPAELRALGISSLQLADEPCRVIELNREVRLRPLFGAQWPPRYLAIGEDGCGDYYCLDLDRPGPPVLFFEHDAGATFAEQAPTLDQWLPLIAEEAKEALGEEDA